MPRQVNVDVGVNTQKGVQSLEKLTKAFEKLNKTIDAKPYEQGIPINIKVDSKASITLDNIRDSIKQMTQDVSIVTKTLKELSSVLTKLPKKLPKADMPKIDKWQKLQATITPKVDSLDALINIVQKASPELVDLQTALFKVGTASQMSLKDISGLTLVFRDLATTIPVSSISLANAVNDLIRTGRGYKESKEIIEEVAKLAVASGSSLEETSKVVNKVMVSFNVNAKDVQETLNTMHSTTIMTATNMEYLASSFKNVASTASVLVKASGLSGKELDAYKQKVLSLNMAILGGMANTGLSASEAGTKTKVMLSKFVAMEKSAKALFDQAMKINNIRVDGSLFNSEALGNMAKEDLYGAVNLMSKLYSQGVLTTQVMQKMFTGRHFMDVANIFSQINGEAEGFVDRMSKGSNYLNDYSKNLYSFQSQLQLLKSKASLSVDSKYVSGLSSVMVLLNDILGVVNKVQIASDKMMPLGDTYVASLQVAATLLAGIKVSLVAMAGLTGPLLWTVGAMSIGLVTIAKHMAQIKKDALDYQIGLDAMDTSLAKSNSVLESMESRLQNIRMHVMDTSQLNLINNSSLDILDKILGKSKDFRQIIEDTASIEFDSQGDIEKQTDVHLNKLKSQKIELSNLKSEMEKVLTLNLEKSLKNSGLKEATLPWLYRKRMVEQMLQDERKLSKELDESGKYLEKTQIVDILKKKYTTLDVQKELANLYTDDFRELQEQVKQSEAEIVKLNATSENVLKNIESKSIASQTKYNKLLATNTDLQYELFKRTGEINFDTGSGMSSFKGLDALTELYKQSSSSNIIGQLEQVKKDILEVNQQLELAKVNENKELTQELISKKEELINRQKEINILKIEEEKHQKLINLEQFKGVELSSKILDYLVRYMITEEQIISLKAQGEAIDKNTLAQLETTKDLLIKNIYAEDEKVKSKERTVKYQIKYVNYLKESLDLELESLKLGKTKGEQEVLTYNYKLKQYQLDKTTAQRELATAKATLDDLKLEQSLRNKINNIRDSKSGQSFIDDFFKQNSTVLLGESAEMKKNAFEGVKNYVSALAKVESITSKMELLPIKQLRQDIEELPNLYQQSYNSIIDISKLDGTPFESVKEAMLQQMISDFEKLQNSVFQTYNIGSMSLVQAIQANLDSLNFAETLQGDAQGVMEFMEQLRVQFSTNSMLSSALQDTGDVNKNLAIVMEILKNEQKDLVDLAKKKLQIDQKDRDVLKDQVKLLESAGSLFSKLGSVTGSSTLGDIGSALSSMGQYTEKMKGLTIDLNTQDLSTSIQNAISSAFEGINMGSSIGAMVGGMTGGGQSAQAGGAMAGMATGALQAMGMLGGPAGMAITAGVSLVAGMFDTSEKDKARAERKTKEANKLYSANTEALKSLTQRMANLSSGVDSLTTTLLNSFNKIPTFDKLTGVQDTLKDLHKVLINNRQFQDVSYQVTKHKNKKGFLGIGASSSSWTETHKISIDRLLSEYGHTGRLEDMDSKELHGFAEWLKNFSIGEQDNSNLLGQAIEDYASSLEKMEHQIGNVFTDITMESFVGISKLQQEQLRQQIEDFYKNLGLTIDKATQEEINKLADQMSVMVTIMQDVRGAFVQQWRDTGLSAGKVFMGAMTPYIDAILNNLSQMYYDTYFSGVTQTLEKEFKSLAENLVELKKQGQKLDWNSVTQSLNNSFEKVFNIIKATREETESFNNILLNLQTQALESGLDLSEVFKLGLSTETQREIFDTFKSGLTGSETALSNIGNMIGNKVGEAMSSKLIDNLMSSTILDLSAQIDKVMSGNLGFESLTELANQSLHIGLMMEGERKRLEAIKDMFNFDSTIEYSTQNENIQYQTGTSSQQVYNYYINGTVEAGNVIESDSIDRLVDSLMDTLLEKLRVDKGIILT